MKLIELEIADFRGIKQLKLSLLDELGRIQGSVPIVGPNTSGKTSILDAIALCLMPVTELVQIRPGLPLTPSALVRRGATQARVTCTVWFSNDEIASAKELMAQLGDPYKRPVPEANEVKVHWRFPDFTGEHGAGRTWCEPAGAELLLKARVLTGRAGFVPGVGPRDLQDRGGVFLFDQQRTGLVMHMTDPGQTSLITSRAGVEVQDAVLAPLFPMGDAVDEHSPRGIHTRDPRKILIQLASRAQAAQAPRATAHEDFERLCELYRQVCQPHRILRLYNAEYGLDMEFEGPGGVYSFDGLSSGQQALLLLLLQFATRRIHRSIVLIDELELHLHPLWQSRLYHSLLELGTDDQVLFTTHSTHLRDLMRDDFVHATGDLGGGDFTKAEV